DRPSTPWWRDDDPPRSLRRRASWSPHAPKSTERCDGHPIRRTAPLRPSAGFVERARESSQPFARSAVKPPGSLIVTPSFVEKRVVSSYLPKWVTSSVPPIAGNPSGPAFTPMAFIRLQKYLL